MRERSWPFEYSYCILIRSDSFLSGNFIRVPDHAYISSPPIWDSTETCSKSDKRIQTIYEMEAAGISCKHK